MTTDTNRGDISKWQGWLSVETALTVNRGVLPGWYQYCGDETVSVTPPGVQAGVLPETWGRRLALWCAGAWPGLADGEAAGGAWLLPCRAGACRAAGVWPALTPWPVVDPVASRPFTAQLRVVSTPAPTPRTTTRRRQYVAAETFGRGPGAPLRTGAPPGRAPLGGGFWLTSSSM